MTMIFDAHCHIIDPRFPLIANNGYLPDSFGVSDYLASVKPLGVQGGAVVSGSFQGFDQGYLLAALNSLGPAFVGVTQLPASVTDTELDTLNAAGVRALRFNLKRGGSEQLDQLEALALRVHERVGWHSELYIDSRELAEIEARLLRLPAISIDHLGLSAEGLPIVLRLAERGVRVKACGFGRVDFPVRDALRDIHAANPCALMFGTDLPSTRAPRPFQADDIELLTDALGENGAQQALWENAANFYRLG
ncbi:MULTISPECIES: amidohydrolase family protein [Pseudomonas syringae group]|uniref:Amidohydrolase family protein n=2 Tax=Pseudomonas syringae group TaxID=136849 RepID=A0ABV4PE18_9PSED|nr:MULTISPECIES: amidohydrolase family protein [Pseudomonas syringae group]KGS15143.1 2-pyrone-4,6-dicarboxylate hydrolase [Pseudomonas coronafaciens]MCQ3016742.1 amidohydrolase family protein [Pseudomonas tremae]MCQ3027924.1 amidohydrolase family protein [Pseudomonas tremae]QGL57759.1 amidohydrolase family protein [Pseudomonas coronafaciens pv. oryzae str. 1_6]